MGYKSVLITGANRGLGFEMVKQLLARKDGPEVVFAACRQPNSAQELHKISSNDDRLHILRIDAEDEPSFEAAAKEVKSKLQDKTGLNLLINNAGIYDTSGLSGVSAESLATSFRINAIAPLLITKAFLPLLQSAPKGSGGGERSHRAAVVNISSGYGSTGSGGGGIYPYRASKAFLNLLKKGAKASKAAVVNISTSLGSIEAHFFGGGRYAYRASKAALNMVTSTLSHDLKNDGIVVVSICPGWVKTDMGGGDAWLTPAQSVSAVLKVVNSLNENDTGKFFNHENKPVPW